MLFYQKRANNAAKSAASSAPPKKIADSDSDHTKDLQINLSGASTQSQVTAQLPSVPVVQARSSLVKIAEKDDETSSEVSSESQLSRQLEVSSSDDEEVKRI